MVGRGAWDGAAAGCVIWAHLLRVLKSHPGDNDSSLGIGAPRTGPSWGLYWLNGPAERPGNAHWPLIAWESNDRANQAVK